MDFESGESKLESFLAHKPATEQTSPFAEQLHLELDSGGDIKTRQPFFETNTPGIFAVGDCATPFKSAGYSAAMGGFTAAGLAQQLQSGSLMW